MEAKVDAPAAAAAAVCICIDASKRESHTAASGFKKLYRRLRASGFKVVANKDDLAANTLDGVDVLVLGAPRERFTREELDCIKDFVAKGGSLCVMACEGGEAKLGCNINELLHDYGV
mmetsp:Transcript_21008/g.72580  ORF Transcript_21008/g.72580 Transcript_21008/m.72580 type:complete len:118 (+) Transcript_21008:61-414(+)